ncbi:MAG: EF-hand domain-containing protein [Pseudomonadota bacterium]|jgi:calmodulin|nr:MAG: calcium sensor EFh [Pseudomonadota bacterium]
MAGRDRTVRDYIRPGTEELTRLREDFNFNDANRDGKITFGEFVRLMSALEAGLTAEECRIGFDEIDTDNDGAIDFEEFAAWWREA